MKLKVICVRDRASDMFAVPQFVASIGAGIRGFSDAINNKRDGNMLAQHPEDFDLYELGEFDDNTGLFSTGQAKQIAVGKDLVVKE